MKIKTLLLVAVPILFASCISFPKPAIVFDLYETSGFSGGSLAVISGIKDAESLELTKGVESLIAESSDIKVLGQEEITAIIPAYPATILDSRSGFSDADRAKFLKIQEKLGTDYILVLWGSYFNQQNNNGSISSSLGIMGRLLEFPGAVPIGETDFQWSMGKKLFEGYDDYEKRFYSGASSTFVDKFLEEIKN